MEKQQKTSFRSVALLTLAVISMLGMLSFASALGVSYTYSKENPLLLSPGESARVPINIQNLVGAEDLKVGLVVAKGNEIASTSQAVYTLKAKTADTFATVLVEIPNDALVGTEYEVVLTLSSVGNKEGQPISLGTAIETSFPVKVVEKAEVEEKPAAVSNTLLIVISVLIILLLFWLIKKLGKKSRRK